MDKFQGGFKNNEYTIDITNDERRYFAIDELNEEYDAEIYYSKTYGIYKRTTIFYSEDIIKKVIYEEKYISNNNELVSESYKEYDTNLKTIDRKLLVPLTSRGKEKKITPTNVMNIDPFGCMFYVKFDYIEKLEEHQLLPVEICADNDIIWNTCPIVLHKEISEIDIDFPLIVLKKKVQNRHFTKLDEEMPNNDQLEKINPEYDLYVEWGLGNVEISSENISYELYKLLEGYKCPYDGVAFSIRLNEVGKDLEELNKICKYKYGMLMSHNEKLRTVLFNTLGLDNNTTFDDFNKKYGGITKMEIVQKLKS